MFQMPVVNTGGKWSSIESLMVSSKVPWSSSQLEVLLTLDNSDDRQQGQVKRE